MITIDLFGGGGGKKERLIRLNVNYNSKLLVERMKSDMIVEK